MAIFELPYVVLLLAGGWLERLRLFYSLTGILSLQDIPSGL